VLGFGGGGVGLVGAFAVLGHSKVAEKPAPDSGPDMMAKQAAMIVARVIMSYLNPPDNGRQTAR
jgi:hypothetical protein